MRTGGSVCLHLNAADPHVPDVLQDERDGNGGGAAYDSDADYVPHRTESDAASPAEPLHSSPQASRVRLQIGRSTICKSVVDERGA